MMSQQGSQDSVRNSVEVPVDTQRAFAIFAHEMSAWWPREYTWSLETLEDIGIEPRENGRCFERGPYDFECQWGRVTRWEPPNRLVFLWQISPTRAPVPDPEKASEVEVRFESDGAQITHVTVDHRGFANHGEGSAAYREAMGSAMGWEYILERYVNAAL